MKNEVIEKVFRDEKCIFILINICLCYNLYKYILVLYFIIKIVSNIIDIIMKEE